MLRPQIDRVVAALQGSAPDEPLARFDRWGLELHPVRPVDVDDDALVAALGAWRAEWMHVYPTQFAVSDEGTRTWLRDVILGAPDRLMFLVRKDGAAVGHLGFDDLHAADGVISLSNVVVGEREAMPPGAMFAVETAMLTWAFSVWPIPAIHAPIFLDNERSVALQVKLGFRERSRTPMRRHELPGGRVAYRPVAEGDAAPPDRIWGRFFLERPAE